MGKYQWHLFALCGGGWMAVSTNRHEKIASARRILIH